MLTRYTRKGIEVYGMPPDECSSAYASGTGWYVLITATIITHEMCVMLWLKEKSKKFAYKVEIYLEIKSVSSWKYLLVMYVDSSPGRY